ncbi:MAG: DUF1297 domain-containing protein [Candidatus Heimdallarchaeaceae archaeon]
MVKSESIKHLYLSSVCFSYPFMGIGNQYPAVYWNEPLSAGKRVGMEIKNALLKNILEKVIA